MFSCLDGYELKNQFAHCSPVIQKCAHRLNVYNRLKLKILTVNSYNEILKLFYAKFII